MLACMFLKELRAEVIESIYLPCLSQLLSLQHDMTLLPSGSWQDDRTFSNTADKDEHAIFAPGDRCNPSGVFRFHQDPSAETVSGLHEPHSIIYDTPHRGAQNHCPLYGTGKVVPRQFLQWRRVLSQQILDTR